MRPSWARLLFDAEAGGREVADDSWHERQQGRWRKDGTYELRVPYIGTREIGREILRHGAACWVLTPRSLAEHIAREHAAAVARYA